VSTRFNHEIIVNNEDIDDLGHVNNVVYVRWIQEVAAAHWQKVSSAELKSKYLWVVLRHEIDYKNPAFINDRVHGTTWVGEHHGARFERFVRLENQDGKLLAEAKTMWCMLDGATLRPTRISEEVLLLL
jgi:acyl-CoA thioester hydrolase